MASDYDAWAQKYDETRGVSPSVLRPLLEALGPPGGRSLLDIGGGTGNYTVALRDHGFRAYHCDPSVGMARRAASKLGHAIVADGQALPFKDGAFDCAVAIKVLNHVADRPAFAREARRVIRSGPLVLVHATRESIEGNWICYYAPSLRTQERFEPESATVDYLRDAGFTDVRVTHVRYTDMADGSAQALKRFPETFLTDEHIMNTSLFSRLPEPERRDALAAIRRDHASGRLREVIAKYEPQSEKHGDGTMFIAPVWPGARPLVQERHLPATAAPPQARPARRPPPGLPPARYRHLLLRPLPEGMSASAPASAPASASPAAARMPESQPPA